MNEVMRATGRPQRLRRTLAVLLYLIAAVLLLAPATNDAAAAAKRDPTAAATDCVACHGSDKVLPAKHKAVKSMTWSDCLGCHEPTDKDSTLAGKMPGAHAHALAGQNCASCHGAGPPATVPTATAARKANKWSCAFCTDRSNRWIR